MMPLILLTLLVLCAFVTLHARSKKSTPFPLSLALKPLTVSHFPHSLCSTLGPEHARDAAHNPRGRD